MCSVRVITPRPNAPWYTNRVGDAKRLRRSYERKWRHSKSEVDRLLYRRQCAVVAKELNCAKRTYLSAKVMGHSMSNHPMVETVPPQILMKIYTLGLYGQKRRFAK